MKTILVTGAVRNTGLAIARRFAADGWGVALTSRDAAAAEESKRKYTILGKTTLADENWMEVAAGEESLYNFFRVTVEMR